MLIICEHDAIKAMKEETSMKEKIGWIVGLIEVLVGFVFFCIAQAEISSNSRYTWRRPYTDYEQQVIMTKWIGLLLLVVGIIGLGIRLYKTMYVNKHTEDINEISKLGGTVKCRKCGLIVAQNTSVCPRCGAEITTYSGDFSDKSKNQTNPNYTDQDLKGSKQQ